MEFSTTSLKFITTVRPRPLVSRLLRCSSVSGHGSELTENQNHEVSKPQEAGRHIGVVTETGSPELRVYRCHMPVLDRRRIFYSGWEDRAGWLPRGIHDRGGTGDGFVRQVTIISIDRQARDARSCRHDMIGIRRENRGETERRLMVAFYDQ